MQAGLRIVALTRIATPFRFGSWPAPPEGILQEGSLKQDGSARTLSAIMEFDTVPVKERPRFNVKSGRAYTPRATRTHELEIQRQWERRHGREMGRWMGEVQMRIVIERPLPKGTPKRVKSKPDTVKPDLDNIAKAFMDALRQRAYSDDGQITKLEIEELPRTRRSDKVNALVIVSYFEEE